MTMDEFIQALQHMKAGKMVRVYDNTVNVSLYYCFKDGELVFIQIGDGRNWRPSNNKINDFLALQYIGMLETLETEEEIERKHLKALQRLITQQLSVGLVPYAIWEAATWINKKLGVDQ